MIAINNIYDDDSVLSYAAWAKSLKDELEVLKLKLHLLNQTHIWVSQRLVAWKHINVTENSKGAKGRLTGVCAIIKNSPFIFDACGIPTRIIFPSSNIKWQ